MPSDGGAGGGKPGYNPTPEDLCLQEFYGDWVHSNPGTHLDGGISNNTVWQAWWRYLVVMPLRLYDTPSGRVERRFVGTLRDDLRGGAGQTVELGAVHLLSDGDPATSPTFHHIPCHQTENREATRRLGGRQTCYFGREYSTHVLRVPHLCPDLTVAQREEMADHQAQTYHILMLRRKLGTAVRWITEGDTGRVLQPEDWGTKTE